MKKRPDITANTRKKLMDAYWQLVLENGIHNITVGLVTKRAGYNRSTFYEYFKDTADLLDQFESELLQDIDRDIQNLIIQANILNEFDFAKLSPFSIQLFTTYGDRICVLLSASGDPAFLNKAKTLLLPVVSAIYKIPKHDSSLETVLTFATSAMLGLIQLWYAKGKPGTASDFAAQAQKLIATGIAGFYNLDFNPNYKENKDIIK